ncbi:homeobox-leucine zipper protein ATHB-7-like [Primulina huaijiensis]|uniref:homeobox-leucine zipper protein ATHB-7-like n=1 Tax=Primulina huaijiensis TaxID=1492673 RepID=UPI003CC72A5D
MFNCDVSNEKQKETRFSDEQIRSLEEVFESETKLEPGNKMKLAKQLGLQPRQIAIWFQNKRARWKSKTIEKDYGLLLADYKNLSSLFEALKKEKQSLLFQLQKLKNETMGKFEENLCQSQIQETAPRNTSIDFLANNTPSKYMQGIVSDDDHSSSVEKVGPLGFDEVKDYQFLNSAMAEVLDVSPTSPLEDLGSLETDDHMMNQVTKNTDQWWF